MLAPVEARRWPIKQRGLRLAVFLVVALASGPLLLFAAERVQEISGGADMTEDISKVPAVDAALVLGTSALMPNGTTNFAFNYRLDAAAALWKAGKAKYLIASGNRTGKYDEPTDMRDGLMARGVPPQAIYRDFRGFRTWDSVVRARDVFGLKRLAIVSQRAHVARALFLARSLGVEAFGFEAPDTPPVDTPAWLRPYEAAVLSYYDAWRGVLPGRPGRPIVVGVDPGN
ncbi:MAG: vancomycin high temperature exclusion protein [Reyranellales bacterium]